MILRGAASLVGLAVLAAPGVALAAGDGYGPSTSSGTSTGPSGAVGGYSSVSLATTVTSAGGSFTSSIDGASVHVSVPRDLTTWKLTLVLTAPDLPVLNAGLGELGLQRFSAVGGVGVALLDPDGLPVAGRFHEPVTISITSPAIHSGERVAFVADATHAIELPATITAHTATFTVIADPDVMVLAPRTTASITRNPYPEPTSTLMLGSTGPSVRWVQWAVDVSTDGMFGAQTRAAVIAFQRTHGLATDGIVGPLTRAALARVTR